MRAPGTTTPCASPAADATSSPDALVATVAAHATGPREDPAERTDPLEFACPRTSIAVRIAPDSVPLGLRIPPEIFQLPLVHIEAALVTALSGAAAALHRELAGEGDEPVDVFGEDDEFEEYGELYLAEAEEIGDVASCLGRLHSVADHLASAHHALLSGDFSAEAPGGTVRVTANAASAVMGVVLRVDFAAEGMDRAAADIAATAAAAVGAANESRARIIERALGEALLDSLGTAGGKE